MRVLKCPWNESTKTACKNICTTTIDWLPTVKLLISNISIWNTKARLRWLSVHRMLKSSINPCSALSYAQKSDKQNLKHILIWWGNTHLNYVNNCLHKVVLYSNDTRQTKLNVYWKNLIFFKIKIFLCLQVYFMLVSEALRRF